MYIEFCGGGAVDGIMTELDRHLTEPEIKCICAPMIEAVAFLHENLVIHRDLKAGNVLLTLKGEVKLGELLGHLESLEMKNVSRSLYILWKIKCLSIG